tara:strand:+ start:129 stop:851 length:723 start_codon:yes stop_codon:yes gene_type:complete
MNLIIFFILHWYLSLFFQTFFLHRYAAHNQYKMNPFWEKIFFLMTFLIQGSSFLHPGAYAIMHRKHHKHSDTINDPHSPVIINNIFLFNKKTVLEYRKVVNQFLNNNIIVKDVPRWVELEKLSELWIVRILFVLLYFVIYNLFSPSFWFYLLIPIHIFMGPLHGFIVNWFGHRYGYRNFKNTKDNSKNTLIIDLIMMGELYQNNHHKKPNNRNFAHRWFELDLGYIISFILIKLRIIKKV